jgi:hypothetical protein
MISSVMGHPVCDWQSLLFIDSKKHRFRHCQLRNRAALGFFLANANAIHNGKIDLQQFND